MINKKTGDTLEFLVERLHTAGYENLEIGFEFSNEGGRLSERTLHLLNEKAEGHIHIPHESSHYLLMYYSKLPANQREHLRKYITLWRSKVYTIPILHKSEPLFKPDPYANEPARKKYSEEERSRLVGVSTFHCQLLKIVPSLLYFNPKARELEEIAFEEVGSDYSHLGKGLSTIEDEAEYRKVLAYKSGIFGDRVYKKIRLHQVTAIITKNDCFKLVPRESDGMCFLTLRKIGIAASKPIPIASSQPKLFPP